MKKSLNILTIVCLILGILAGVLLPEQIQKLSFIGTIYINLLKFMIIPIIFTTITVTIYNSAKVKGKLIAKTIVLFILMFATTFIITSLIVAIFKPGINFTFEETEWTGAFAKFNLSEIFINLFPINIVTMIQNNAVFPTTIFSILCGICSLKIDDGKKLINIIELLKNLFSKILEYIMYLTPIAVFSIMGTTIATYGNLILGICAKYIGIAYLCSLITMIIVMILPVWVIAKINPIKYIKKYIIFGLSL